MNPQLSNGGLYLEYYKKDTILTNPEARTTVVLPDIKPLPSFVSKNWNMSAKVRKQATTRFLGNLWFIKINRISYTTSTP
jgi:hypothetical protein